MTIKHQLLTCTGFLLISILHFQTIVLLVCHFLETKLFYTHTGPIKTEEKKRNGAYMCKDLALIFNKIQCSELLFCAEVWM